ncbi:hypothetical protein [Agrobacterium tumefaciens]|uniref:hypothetical protein n=1 Tax=Agrobacterium tumefaciens TaxID=358 RepID=UPI00286472BD|nr:hypothetical protein [Agrobacterium tumefaciens]MDR6591566.1 hypothetical protein [Agrobacterium tumefaciens]
MDIATGLSLLSQATGVVKDLREIDKGYDAAALKAQMADLYGTLADVKIALSDARETIHERDLEIKTLEAKIAALTSGEACPLCNAGRMKIFASKPHPHFAFAGVQERSLKCDACGHSENHIYDPREKSKSR